MPASHRGRGQVLAFHLRYCPVSNFNELHEQMCHIVSMCHTKPQDSLYTVDDTSYELYVCACQIAATGNSLVRFAEYLSEQESIKSGN